MYEDNAHKLKFLAGILRGESSWPIHTLVKALRIGPHRLVTTLRRLVSSPRLERQCGPNCWKLKRRQDILSQWRFRGLRVTSPPPLGKMYLHSIGLSALWQAFRLRQTMTYVTKSIMATCGRVEASHLHRSNGEWPDKSDRWSSEPWIRGSKSSMHDLVVSKEHSAQTQFTEVIINLNLL